jgi:osmotically-inducible protein OsmY
MKRSDTDIRRDVEAEAPKRLALHETDRIHVEVNDSTITLSGQVHSCQEQSDAEAAVWMIPGVKHVENRLEMR